MRIRPTVHFSLIQGLFWGSFASVFSFASIYLLAKGFTNTQVGYVMAAGSVASAFLQPLVGGYADRSRKMILHRLIIVLLGMVVAVSGILLGFGKGFFIVAFCYGAIVMLLQVITPLTYSLGIFFMKKGVNINFGICRGIGSITYAFVATILGIIIEKTSENAVVASVFLIYVLLIVAVFFFHFPGVQEVKDEADVHTGKDDGGLISFMRGHRYFSLVLLGNVLAFVSHNIIGNFIFQIVSYHGYSSKEMGFAVSLAAACELPTLFFLSVINRKISTVTLFRTSVIFIFIKNLCMYFATTLPMIYFSMSLQLLGYGLFAGISVIYVNEAVDTADQTKGQALMTMTVTVGGVIGSLLGGKLLDMVDVPGMLLVSGIIALLGAVIVCMFCDKEKKHCKNS